MSEIFDEYERALRGRPSDRRKFKGLTVGEGLVYLGGTWKMVDKNLSVSGKAYIKGPIELETVKVSGRLECDGDLSASTVKISGTLRVFGNFKSGYLAVSGSAKIDKICNIETCKISGRIEAKEFKGGDYKISGLIKGFTVKANSLRVSGKIKMDEDIEVDELYLKRGELYARGIIKAGEIVVERGRRESWEIKILGISLIKIGSTWEKGRSIIRAKKLEANFVKLEETSVYCDIYGKKVILGPDTVVHGNVYYSEHIEIDPNAQILGEVKQVS